MSINIRGRITQPEPIYNLKMITLDAYMQWVAAKTHAESHGHQLGTARWTGHLQEDGTLIYCNYVMCLRCKGWLFMDTTERMPWGTVSTPFACQQDEALQALIHSPTYGEGTTTGAIYSADDERIEVVLRTDDSIAGERITTERRSPQVLRGTELEIPSLDEPRGEYWQRELSRTGFSLDDITWSETPVIPILDDSIAHIYLSLDDDEEDTDGS